MKKKNEKDILVILEEFDLSHSSIRLELERLSQAFCDLKDIYDSIALSGVSYKPVFTGQTNKTHDTFDILLRRYYQYQDYLGTQYNTSMALQLVLDEYSRFDVCLSILSTVRKTHHSIIYKIYIEKMKREALASEMCLSKNTIKKYREEAIRYLCNIYNLECENRDLFVYAREHISDWMEI